MSFIYFQPSNVKCDNFMTIWRFGEATFVIFNPIDKKEFRVLIKHCFLMGKNTSEAMQWLDKRYGDSAPGETTIDDWYAEFKRGHTNTDDAERSGRPKLAVDPKNQKVVCLQFCTNLWGCLSYFWSRCRVCSHPTKNNNASRIQSATWSCSSEVKRIFCVGMWQRMKHGSKTTHLK